MTRFFLAPVTKKIHFWVEACIDRTFFVRINDADSESWQTTRSGCCRALAPAFLLGRERRCRARPKSRARQNFNTWHASSLSPHVVTLCNLQTGYAMRARPVNPLPGGCLCGGGIPPRAGDRTGQGEGTPNPKCHLIDRKNVCLPPTQTS